MEVLPAIVLYAEVILFSLVDRNLWRTLYTPFNILAIPYSVVLALCLAIDGHMGFGEFYYPSIWVWVVGLAVFFVPSFLLGMLYNAATRGNPVSLGVYETDLRTLEKITQAMLALFAVWILYLLLISPFKPGSDDFGIAVAGRGLFGHLFTVLMALCMLWIMLLDKQHKRYWWYVLGFVVVALLYLVKSWLMVPLLGGIFLRLLTKRMHLRVKLVAGVVIGGFVFFFLSYWVTMFMARWEWGMQRYGLTRSEYAVETAQYIQKHFVTYLTAGVYGLSEDMSRGIVETQDPTKIYTSLINVAHLFTGEEMVSPINEHYIVTTKLDNNTNVRTLMGSLYIYLGASHAIAYLLVFSILAHLLFFAARQRESLLGLVIVGWLLGNLFMGWFEFYFQHLNFITVPLFTFALWEICYYVRQRFPSNGLLQK